MKLALISDLHANLVALEAVLSDIDSVGVDQIVCLGDIASLGPQPREVVARIRSLECLTVQGNHDPLLKGSPILGELEEWTIKQLDEDDIAFLRSLPSELEIQLGGLKSLCVHGSPRSFNDQILASTDDKQLETIFGDKEFDVLFCGHTHVQLLRRLQGRSIVGVGSVGIPYLMPFDGTRPPQMLKTCEYAIASFWHGKLSVDFRQLPYDFDLYRKSVIDRNMPYKEWWCNQWI